MTDLLLALAGFGIGGLAGWLVLDRITRWLKPETDDEWGDRQW
jgi:hypothetical protein